MSIIVAMPERFGLPPAPADRVLCARCGAGCWLSKRAALMPDDTIACMPCTVALLRPGDIVRAAPWVELDLSLEAARNTDA